MSEQPRCLRASVGRRTHARTARPRADVRGEPSPMGITPTSIAQLSSLCSLCLCALCVQRTPRGGVLHGIEVCCWEVAFDTEDTEAQRTQRKFRYFSSGLCKPFDTSSGVPCPEPVEGSERTDGGGMQTPAPGSKPSFAKV